MGDPREAVRAAAEQLLRALAGCRAPVRVAATQGGLACLIQVWGTGQAIPTAKDVNRRAGCRQDILKLVGDAGRPLTRKDVIRGLRDGKKPHGTGTVAKALAELTKGGELVNPKDKRGYRLPDWPRRPNTPSLFDAR